MSLLEIKNLHTYFTTKRGLIKAAYGVSLKVEEGKTLGIVGESGSGKSVTVMSILKLFENNQRIHEGEVWFQGEKISEYNDDEIRKIRGNKISVIFQEPMTSLNPVLTVTKQVSEVLMLHQGLNKEQAHARTIELLKSVGIANPEKIANTYSFQLSGGMSQRVMIAMALACRPKLLIADEPTTALDVTVQAEILKLMRDLRHRINSGILLITHDMGVVADLADRILVMKDGHVVERGIAERIFKDPQHPYTRQLLSAVPHLGSVAVAERDAATTQPEQTTATPRVLEARGLSIEYPKRGRTPAFRAVDKIDLDIAEGEVVGLVGESGSGKTTVGRAVVGLLPAVEGTLKVNGHDMVGISPANLRKVRQDVSIVFQDPGSSLNPRLPVGESIGEPLLLHKVAKGKELQKRIEELLDQVHLPRAMRNRYPHELSGGQRQRVGIARALALSPKLLVADEPTSALDVSVQAKVLELFAELQREHGFACIFISHDLAVVEMLSRRIAVMHRGKIVEFGTREQVLGSPEHPYTQRLLAAVPVPDPAEQRLRRETRDRLLAQEAASMPRRHGASDPQALPEAHHHMAQDPRRNTGFSQGR